jgi:hypothetical protein
LFSQNFSTIFFSVLAVEKESKLFNEKKSFGTNKVFFSFATAQTEKNSWKKLGKQNWWFGSLLSRTRIFFVKSLQSVLNLTFFRWLVGEHTALLKKMDYKDVVIAIDGSLFRYLLLKSLFSTLQSFILAIFS